MLLKVGDKYDKIVDVMNNCFGWNYKACMRGSYVLNREKRTSAWFPKIADISGGKPQPGDKWYGWCNSFSADGRCIYMNNFENPQLLSKDAVDGVAPHVTFVKYPGEKQYTYAGVFTRTRREPELGWIYEKIADDIDTKEYI